MRNLKMLFAMLIICTQFAVAQTFPNGTQISIQTDTKEWISRCKDCQEMNRDIPYTASSHYSISNAARKTETFTVVNKDGKIALKADNGGYLKACYNCAKENPSSVISIESLPSGASEIPNDYLFKFEEQSDGSYTIQSSNGRYWTRYYRQDGKKKIIATYRPSADINQGKFKVVVQSMPNEKPAPPKILSPSANGTVPNNCDNTKIKWDFNWTDVPNATEYQIYVARQGAANPVVNNVTTTQSNYTHERARSSVVDGLLDNWYVRVRAKVDGTWTDWTANQPFKVAACPKPTTIKFSNSSIYAVSYEITIKHSDPNLLPSVQSVDIGIAGASKSITVPGDATVSVKGSALKIATWTEVFHTGYESYGSGKTWCYDIVTGLGTLGYTRKECQ